MFGRKLSSFRHAWRTIAIFAAVPFAGACHGEIVTIGDKPAPTYHFGLPRLVVELATYSRTNNATLTEDLLEIYFASTRDQDDLDIWTASRLAPGDMFGAPQKVRSVSSRNSDTGSSVSTDGLTLWISSERRSMGTSGGLDIWVSTRASRAVEWGDPVLVPALNSSSFDIPRPPGVNGLVMPLGSERGAGSVYRTFFASRASIASPFETPQAVPELTFEGATTMDAFLSNDGLTVFYASGPVTMPNEGGVAAGVDAGVGEAGTWPQNSADLYVGRREKIEDPFSGFIPIAELNTPFEERDPWLSADKKHFFFSSDRGGNLNIYTCDVTFE